MIQSLLEKAKSGVTLLGDGAMGTELQNRGLPAGGCPEEYNVSHPEIIQAIYHDYFDAGSEIVETNTFGGNRSRLALHNFEERVAEFCKRSAQLAREVCPEGRFVAGSMGPTGDILEPLGPRTLTDALEMFSEQAEALAEGGVDVIFVETMMAAEEAEIAVRAAKKTTQLPVVATMTFEMGKAGLRTMWGVDVETAVNRLTAAGADIVGSNCGTGFDDMIAIVEEMVSVTTFPIIAQPNAGIPQWEDGVSVYRETPEIIKPKAEKLLDLGVAILGGCCGTNPDHIRMMRQLLDARKA
ncbi:MAG: homocysteine S-methyltransferase family protein [Candidatus Neomarinimicrobiota bacterium]